MKKIKYKIKNSSEIGLFHDSRRDVKTLMKVCSDLISTVNELVDEINILKAGNKTGT